ncbi:MAG: respiratory nitrate reductase subunit gamma [candidate division WOR-3 bacterium]
MEFIFYYITPYIAVFIFIAGLLYRLIVWHNSKSVAAHLSLFPRPQGLWQRFLDTLIDMFTMRGLVRVNRPLWLGGFIMHFGLFFVLAGHLRSFTDFYFLWNILGWGKEEIHQFSATVGTIAGTLFTIPLFYLLGRRMSSAVKTLSIPEDYFALFLLIAIALTGFHMRLLRTVEIEELHRYFGGLATLHWQPVPESTGPAFIYHFTFVQLLTVYLPFSKFMHIFGSVFSKMVTKS